MEVMTSKYVTENIFHDESCNFEVSLVVSKSIPED